MSWPCRPCCPLTECRDCPDELLVTFSGVTDVACSLCDEEFDNSFVLARTAGDPCLFEFLDTFDCPSSNAAYRITLNWDDLVSDIVVVVSIGSGAHIIIFQESYLVGEGGVGLCNLDDPFEVDYDTGSELQCDFSAATCTVDVVP